LVGRSPYLQPVQVMAPSTLIGEIADVEITAIGSNSLFGTLQISTPSHGAARVANQSL
jgi:tRNA-2-methylthio-N6-dimethylallyladenosine synthase